ncbi:MAG TPA: hypothetical protein VK662_05375 [Acidothermaceae bacterium]|jgi:hypothetical protein|nr:hypothetical protein [Acidothermaceae bacterium]
MEAIEAKLLDDIRVAWRTDLVIILEFVGSHVGTTMVRRRDTLRVSSRISERSPLLPGELAAAWVLARDGETCLFLRAANGTRRTVLVTAKAALDSVGPVRRADRALEHLIEDAVAIGATVVRASGTTVIVVSRVDCPRCCGTVFRSTLSPATGAAAGLALSRRYSIARGGFEGGPDGSAQRGHV